MLIIIIIFWLHIVDSITTTHSESEDEDDLAYRHDR
jgi:hypothetical protein